MDSWLRGRPRWSLRGSLWLGLFSAGLGIVHAACAEVEPTTPLISDTTDTNNPADTSPPPLTLVVDHAQWQIVAPENDLRADHRPAEIECSTEGFYTEENTFEIDTGICNYVAVSQPSLVPIGQGDAIELSLWYGPLISGEIAEGHAALFIGETLVWEILVPIPNPGGLHVDVLTAPRDFPAGTSVQFHLHNHGLNTWTLAYIGTY